MESNKCEILFKLGPCSTILSYYGYSFDAIVLLSFLGKRANEFWYYNKTGMVNYLARQTLKLTHTNALKTIREILKNENYMFFRLNLTFEYSKNCELIRSEEFKTLIDLTPEVIFTKICVIVPEFTNFNLLNKLILIAKEKLWADPLEFMEKFIVNVRFSYSELHNENGTSQDPIINYATTFVNFTGPDCIIELGRIDYISFNDGPKPVIKLENVPPRFYESDRFEDLSSGSNQQILELMSKVKYLELFYDKGDEIEYFTQDLTNILVYFSDLKIIQLTIKGIELNIGAIFSFTSNELIKKLRYSGIHDTKYMDCFTIYSKECKIMFADSTNCVIFKVKQFEASVNKYNIIEQDNYYIIDFTQKNFSFCIDHIEYEINNFGQFNVETLPGLRLIVQKSNIRNIVHFWKDYLPEIMVTNKLKIPIPYIETQGKIAFEFLKFNIHDKAQLHVSSYCHFIDQLLFDNVIKALFEKNVVYIDSTNITGSIDSYMLHKCILNSKSLQTMKSKYIAFKSTSTNISSSNLRYNLKSE